MPLDRNIERFCDRLPEHLIDMPEGNLVGSGPIASAPAASGYPAGAIVYDNVTNTAWIAVDGVWGLTDCPDVGEQTILIDENGTILIDSDYVVFVED